MRLISTHQRNVESHFTIPHKIHETASIATFANLKEREKRKEAHQNIL